MTKHGLVVWCLALTVACLCVAQQTTIKQVPARNVDPSSGQKMYVTYCAVCHGMDGKGAGPAVSALKVAPPDLTLLARKKNGKFPHEEVEYSIRGDSAMPASHGTKDMPVWGGLFSAMCGGSTKNEASMRVYNITEYVKSLQQ